MTKILLLLTSALALVIMACGDQATSENPASKEDIQSFLQKPGMITHVRYTTFTPPWPTRTEAWIDWENNRIRSWNVQWTDNPTNPYVCTSIRDADSWYPCLPSLMKFEADNEYAQAFWPKIPLRASESELTVNLRGPNPFDEDEDEENSKAAPVMLVNDLVTREESQGDSRVSVASWPIASDIDLPCEDGAPGSASFDYTTTAEGEPLSEFITLNCEEGDYPTIGVLYHEIEFVERSSLPDDFFDVDAVSQVLMEDQLSSAAAQLGSVFWLGEGVGDWKLSGAEHDSKDARVYYSRGTGDDEETVELETRPGLGQFCGDGEPLTSGAYEGSLCPYEYIGDASYRISWRPDGFQVTLEKSSYPETITKEEILSLASSLAEWGDSATGPLLTTERVRDLVADSLELVCPSARQDIREARTQPSSFRFDRVSGEWLGMFGTFGEYAVPDSKPVAIPLSQRETVESTLSHNAAQFAECAADEAPEPQEGDDEFGVIYDGQDDDGFSFVVTGLNTEAETGLTFCLADPDERCELKDPSGSAVEFYGINIDALRDQVVEVEIGVDPERIGMEGTWTFDVDLGDGRTASTSFEVP